MITAAATKAPSVPSSHIPAKLEAFRRNFIKGLVLLGGIIVAAQFMLPVDSYLRGSAEGSATSTQLIQDVKTGQQIRTSDVSENHWTTFV